MSLMISFWPTIMITIVFYFIIISLYYFYFPLVSPRSIWQIIDDDVLLIVFSSAYPVVIWKAKGWPVSRTLYLARSQRHGVNLCRRMQSADTAERHHGWQLWWWGVSLIRIYCSKEAAVQSGGRYLNRGQWTLGLIYNHMNETYIRNIFCCMRYQ